MNNSENIEIKYFHLRGIDDLTEKEEDNILNVISWITLKLYNYSSGKASDKKKLTAESHSNEIQLENIPNTFLWKGSINREFIKGTEDNLELEFKINYELQLVDAKTVKLYSAEGWISYANIEVDNKIDFREVDEISIMKIKNILDIQLFKKEAKLDSKPELSNISLEKKKSFDNMNFFEKLNFLHDKLRSLKDNICEFITYSNFIVYDNKLKFENLLGITEFLL